MEESNRKELRHTFFHLFTLDVSVFPVTHDVYKRSKKTHLIVSFPHKNILRMYMKTL